MKKIIIWGLLAALLVLIGVLLTQSDEPVDEAARRVDHQKFLPKRQLIADLDSMVHFFAKVHPNPYRFRTEAELAAELEAIQRQLPDSLSTLDFWRLIDGLICGYTDAHSNATDRYVLNDYVQQGGLFFPLAAEIRNDKIFVAEHQAQQRLAPGTEITKINGVNTSDLIDNLTQHSNKETRELDLLYISENFGFYLWKAFEWSTRFDIHYQKDEQANTLDSITLAGVTWQERPATANREYPDSYAFEWLTDQVGSMRVSDFNGGRADFKRFCEESFQQLREQEAKYLILDFRHHSGGADQYGEDLAQYIATQPFRKLAKAYWKITPEFKQVFDRRFVPKGIRWFKPIYLINEYSSVFYGAEPDEMVTVNYEFKDPLPEAERFTGQVFLVTGHHTFSAASIFAEMFNHFDMGTSVGQPTGNLCSFNGFALAECVLPHSKLTFQVSSVYNVANNGEEGQVSVEPDIFVPRQEDPLAYILNHLLQ